MLVYMSCACTSAVISSLPNCQKCHIRVAHTDGIVGGLCTYNAVTVCVCVRVLEREGESGWPVRLMHKYTACSLAHGLVNEENAYVDKCKGLSVTESLNIITHAHASTHTHRHTQSSKPSGERVPAHLVSSDSMSASHSKRFQSRQRC